MLIFLWRRFFHSWQRRCTEQWRVPGGHAVISMGTRQTAFSRGSYGGIPLQHKPSVGHQLREVGEKFLGGERTRKGVQMPATTTEREQFL